MIILDIETNGLLPECDTIHCAVTYNTLNGDIHSFVPDKTYDAMCANVGSPTSGTHPLRELTTHLDTLPQMSCHNGVGFDLKVLKKILNYEYKGRYVDTLLLSRILMPDLDNASYLNEDGEVKGAKNPHSIESWGIRFGIKKPEHTDWSKFSLEMLHRCVEDTKIQGKLWDYLYEKVKEVCAKDPTIKDSFKNIINMEQKVWSLIEEQADYGWAFDVQAAYKLVDDLSSVTRSIEEKLIPMLPLRVVQVTKSESGATKAFKADGDMTVAADEWFAKTWSPTTGYIATIEGDFCKVTYQPFNIRSSQQVKDYLLEGGWEPKEWNFKKDKHNKPIRDSNRQLIKTSPKVPKTAEDWDEIAQQINNPAIGLLAEYNKASHRLSQVQGLIRNVRTDHRIEAQANTCSTNTARMTHRIVVNIPKADDSVYYGKEMRSLFVAGPGKVLVGCDAAALEARCEAHYVYDYSPSAARELIEGDIHTLNAKVFDTTRQIAKGGKYAILYGCSPQKLAQTIGKPLHKAKKIYDDYWEANIGLKQLKEDLENQFESKGYILAIDGRPLTIRYKHAILNTLLQSCGSISMKIALCIADKELKASGIKYHFVGNFHDEIQTECLPKDADAIGKILVGAIQKAGVFLKLNVPLDGEYKIGKTWGDTH